MIKTRKNKPRQKTRQQVKRANEVYWKPQSPEPHKRKSSGLKPAGAR